MLAFNLNTLADSRNRPLPALLLSQYYLSCGYSANLIYARVIEAELDKQGKLSALHSAVEKRAKKPWADIQKNLSFYRTHLYNAACEVAPEVFSSPQDVDQSLKEAERGELHNVAFLVDTILFDLKERERKTKKQQRLLLVLDESGQWIEDDQGRLSQLQALVEEAAIKGQGKLWIIVTTHGDMGSIYKEARAIEGDMKKIEGRFRFKPALTTENIELVLEDRLFKKTIAGRQQIDNLYETRGQRITARPRRAGERHESHSARMHQGEVRDLLPVLPVPGASHPGDRQGAPVQGGTRRTDVGFHSHTSRDHAGHSPRRPAEVPGRGARRARHIRRSLQQPFRRG